MSEQAKQEDANLAAGQTGVEQSAAGQVGLGIDLVDIARMRRVLERTPTFAAKVFSEAERAYCESRANPESHYATRFAAKEAVVKALGTGFTQGITVRDIEVVRTAKGLPRVALHGRALEIAREQGVVSLPISLSFTHDEAVACAMAITRESAEAVKRKEDPMRQLTRQFKEARTLIENLDRPRAEQDAGDDGKEA